MRAKKDPKTGKWYIRFRYTDWQGKRRETMKRGFETKHDAEEWLRTFLSEQKADLNITFADFTEMYFKPLSFYAFEMLYWCGIREGELLALTPNDFDFKAKTVTINKSYQRIHKEDVITCPKTKKSNRTIVMPDILCEEMQEYINMFYKLEESDRLFPITKHYLKHEMERGSKIAGVKRIKIHNLRHSAISLLIEMSFSAVAIAERVGHESIDITYRYSHMFPSTQTEMADKLNNIRKESEENVG